jgi:plastocyanin
MQRTRGAIAVAGAIAATLVLPAVAGAATKVVYAGPPPSVNKIVAKTLGKSAATVSKLNPDINAFFRQRVTINAGDTVSFQLMGFHTIDLPGKSGAALPLLVPGKIVTGVNDAAGNPFWFNGHVPSIGLNLMLGARSGPNTYNGTQRIDSGLPLGSGAPKPLKVRFTKPGVYKYFCDVHPGMIGYVVVKAKGKPVPSAKQDTAALTAQVTTDALAAKKLLKTKQPPDHVSLGESGPGGVELYDMFPASLSVNPGAVVTFSMSKDSFETHTATFGPQKVLNQLATGFDGVAFPAQGVYPSDPTQPIVVIPTSHGNGFGNVGALDENSRTPAIPSSRTIKFTTPGVYHFICLIHPFMHGTIIVK